MEFPLLNDKLSNLQPIFQQYASAERRRLTSIDLVFPSEVVAFPKPCYTAGCELEGQYEPVLRLEIP